MVLMRFTTRTCALWQDQKVETQTSLQIHTVFYYETLADCEELMNIVHDYGLMVYSTVFKLMEGS